MKLFYKFCLILCALSPLTAHTQDKTGKLSGIVTDSLKTPVTYATISLFKKDKLTEAYKTTYTNKKGYFEITADTGSFNLNLSYVGHASLNIPVTIAQGNNILDSITLSVAAKTLDNITIRVKKPLVEVSDDKIIYNAELDPSAKTSVATDLLRKTPLVTVDGDGNVQLNGQTNFKVLLNNRETSLFALNVKEALKNFPGAVISKIEVITSPSAKYDAEGVGGIINIVTKKKIIGYNGSLTSAYSTPRTDYSESLTLNAKGGRIGLSAFAAINGRANFLKSDRQDITIPVGNSVFSKRTIEGESANKYRNPNANLEITYDLDSFKTVALYGNLGKSKRYNTLNQTVLTEFANLPSQTGLLQQDDESDAPSSGFGAEYIGKFKNKPGKELSFLVNDQFSNSNSINNSLQNEQTKNRFIKNESRAKNRELTVQTDFVKPFKEKIKLETGIKAIFRKASSDFESLYKYNSSDPYKTDPSNSDFFRYRQEVYGAYTSLSFTLKKYSFRTGLRIEHTDISGNFISSATTVKQRYTNLIPNFLISRKFGPVYSLSVSYNKRLQRPYITSLNPYVNNTDSLRLSFGNPNLGPQILHSASLQNRFIKGNFWGTLILNGSYTNNLIVQYASFDNTTGITRITSANVGKEYQLGIGLNLGRSSNKGSFGFYSRLLYNHIENKANLLQQNKGVSGTVGAYFWQPVVGKFTLSGSGGIARAAYSLVNSPSVTPYYQVNFGYSVFKEKISFSMNVNNFHARTYNYKTITQDPYFRALSSNQQLFRVIYFVATYRFGGLRERTSKKKGVENDDLVN
ncbi:MAG TPA: outer membrane beta-barrel protein [Chitinophagaceae bacterium]|nr:outer membrane beta-barrel protein [Chitinophagaceae bacterium]